MADRGQLPLALVEAAIGVVLVLAVGTAFAVGVPSPASEPTQLDAYADDVATVLASEPPRHAGTTRLGEVARSEAAFEREAAALDRRTDRILPANLLYRVETPHGSVGYPVPAGVEVGERTVATGYGAVTIRVWYA
jgi:hypothetical protein